MTPNDQKRLIANLMARHRAAWRDDGRRAYHFPKFTPRMRTAEYLRLYAVGRRAECLPYDLESYRRPAPALMPWPEAIDETADLLEAA